MTDHQEHIEKLADLIDDIEVAMLTTITADGQLRSRPMNSRQDDFDGTLWFFTRQDAKVEEIQANPQVNVSYASPQGRQEYVSFSGKAELVHDRAKMEELWTPLQKAWYPDGLDEPGLALLKITVEYAEYWDSPSSFVAHTVGFVDALISGEQSTLGEHDEVDLN